MEHPLHSRRLFILIGLSLLPLLSLVLLHREDEGKHRSAESPLLKRTQVAPRTAPPAPRTRPWLAEDRWQHEVETVFGKHEAQRSRILTRKETVDSEIYLLAVEPPSEREIAEVRGKIENLIRHIDPARRTAFEERLKAVEADYDPYGNEGPRVIQIDVPDEPNGRLTGFTCRAENFTEITKKFENGEMADLQNVRGYAATYAGMPLTRFDALLVMGE